MMIEGIEIDGFMAISIVLLVYSAACVFVWVTI